MSFTFIYLFLDLVFLTNTSPFDFHDTYFTSHSWSSAFFFRIGILALKFRGVQPASIFSFHPVLYIYLYIGDNVSFKFEGKKNILMSCCTHCNYLIMLSLRIWLNFNSDLYFICELNMMNTDHLTRELRSFVIFFGCMRYYQFQFDSYKHTST